MMMLEGHEKEGTPVCLSLQITAVIATIYNAPRNKRLIIDQMTWVDTSGVQNDLTLSDRYTLASGVGGLITTQKYLARVAANATLELTRIEGLFIMAELRAVSTGNGTLSITGREV
jgi:hypothetical protein